MSLFHDMLAKGLAADWQSKPSIERRGIPPEALSLNDQAEVYARRVTDKMETSFQSMTGDSGDVLQQANDNTPEHRRCVVPIHGYYTDFEGNALSENAGAFIEGTFCFCVDQQGGSLSSDAVTDNASRIQRMMNLSRQRSRNELTGLVVPFLCTTFGIDSWPTVQIPGITTTANKTPGLMRHTMFEVSKKFNMRYIVGSELKGCLMPIRNAVPIKNYEGGYTNNMNMGGKFSIRIHPLNIRLLQALGCRDGSVVYSYICKIKGHNGKCGVVVLPRIVNPIDHEANKFDALLSSDTISEEARDFFLRIIEGFAYNDPFGEYVIEDVGKPATGLLEVHGIQTIPEDS